MFAFVTVGASMSFGLRDIASQRYHDDSRTELLTIAKLLSTEVDVKQHETLVKPEQMNSEVYKSQIAKLALAKAQLTDVRFVYTMRPTKKGLTIVLDPTPPGDADRDGVEDKSNLMDPYVEATPTMWRVLRTGVPEAETEIAHDKWGDFLSGYAPLVNNNGRVVGLIGVDRKADVIVAHLALLDRATLWSLILVVLVGALASTIAVHQVAHREGAQTSSWLIRALHRVRAGVLQTILFVIAFSVFAVGGFAYRSQRSLESDYRHSLNRSSRLERLDNSLARLDDPSADAVAKQSTLELAHATGVGQGLQSLTLPSSILNLATSVAGEIRQEDRRGTLLQSDIDACSNRVEVAFIAALLLSALSLVLVRGASRQEQQRIDAESLAVRNERAYSAIAENLPIGFFTYSGAQIGYANRAGRELFGCTETDATFESIVSRIHPDDWTELSLLIGDAEQRRIGYQSTYRVVAVDGTVRHCETHGVPVLDTDGNLEHMLGFVLDITQRVVAQQEAAQRHREVKESNGLLSQAVLDLEDNFDAMVDSLVKVVEAKDPYTAGHSERVMVYSLRIGKRMGIPSADLKILQMGTLIHDIGKICIPDEILTKPSGLSPEEFRIVRLHPQMGAQIIGEIPAFAECLPIVLHHHERLDGSGYPDQLQGDQISTLVRIAAVADCFDAMTSDRAYRVSLTAEQALNELRKDAERGTLDPKIVAHFADVIECDGVLWKPIAVAA